jgi:transposase
MENIAFDSHKRYTLCSVENEKGQIIKEQRIEHERGEITRFLKEFTHGSPVAVETIGNWYWIIDEIEAAGMNPRLVHARKAKLLMGSYNKTDRLDVRGLNRLQRVGCLPDVWIPPGELRDKRDLSRTRMYLVNQRTCLKNRIHSTLAKYALSITGVSDIFGPQSRELLKDRISQLPKHCRFATRLQLSQINSKSKEIDRLDKLMKKVFDETAPVKLLRSMPGIGFVFGIVLSVEVGDVNRFASPQKLASYAGTTPRVHSSGGKTRYGRSRPDVNRYLKWAYNEAGNTIMLNRKKFPERHTSILYERISRKKGHVKAVGAVARHLAEATYWILKKMEPYKDPALKHITSRDV